jgi:hypothetical protein
LGGFVSVFAVDPLTYVAPGAVAVDSSVGGGVYVTAFDATTFVPVVLKYDAAGALAHGLDVSGSTTSINYGPVAVDPGNGTVYVAAVDTADPNVPVQVIDSFDRVTGAFIASFDGADGSPDNGFGCGVTGLAVDTAHRVYALVPCKGRVDRYSSAGVFEMSVDGAGVDGGSRGTPLAVATDPVSDEVYVAEAGRSGLQVTNFTAGGTSVVQTFPATGVGNVSEMAVGPDATVYLGDNSANSVIARFTAFDGPTVSTQPASGIGTGSVTLNGMVDAGGVAAQCHYEYGLDEVYGTSTGDVAAGSGSSPVGVPVVVAGLVPPNTTYHYRIVCSNSSGSIVGDDQSFTTLSAPPIVDGQPTYVAAIGPSTVQVHGTVDPRHTETGVHIDYGTTTTYGSQSTAASAGATAGDTVVVANLTGLSPGTLYHFRVSADNSAGSQQGADGTFITAPAAPAGATDLTTAKATLTATVDPHGVSSTYRFEYGPSAAYGSSTPETAAGSGDGEQGVTQPIDGLSPGQTYHVRVVTTSSDGVIRNGADGTFITPPAPIATVTNPTDVSLDGSVARATLMGGADTHGLTGTYHFELSSLNSAYSTTTPERPIPTGDGVQHLSATVSGLPLSEAFRVRLIVTSDDAIDYSDQITFATPPAPRTFPPAPPTGEAFGCTSPRLDAYNHQPKPGETITITGTGLGTGGSIVLGDQTLPATTWTASGLSLQIPADAKGTLALTINCGQTSNTIAIVIYHQPNNTITITKTTTTATAARVTVKVPGPGKLQTTSPHTTTKTTTVTKAGTTTITIRLTRAGIRTLNRAKTHRLKTTIKVRYTPTSGQPNTKTTAVTSKAKAAVNR